MQTFKKYLVFLLLLLLFFFFSISFYIVTSAPQKIKSKIHVKLKMEFFVERKNGRYIYNLNKNRKNSYLKSATWPSDITPRLPGHHIETHSNDQFLQWTWLGPFIQSFLPNAGVLYLVSDVQDPKYFVTTVANKCPVLLWKWLVTMRKWTNEESNSPPSFLFFSFLFFSFLSLCLCLSLLLSSDTFHQQLR